MSEDKFLEYPNEMIQRCADNCDTLRDKNAKLEAANKVLREAVELFIENEISLAASGDAGFYDAEETERVIKGRAAIKAADEIERQ